MEITNKTKLQELINYVWKLIEDNEPFDVEKCPELEDCQKRATTNGNNLYELSID